MSGIRLIEQIRRLETKLDKLGFVFANSRYNSYNGDYRDMVAIAPKDLDVLPIYSRDAQIFNGTIDELERWIQGVEWARDYDRMLELSNEKKRIRKEQDWRNKQLLNTIKGTPTPVLTK